ncbi:MAG TPA: hypothetical protein VJU84_14770 [Pyrinomonadaceae bacterium]|nr:hypothetical protein [Pyrinomonadaceae bacterium]
MNGSYEPRFLDLGLFGLQLLMICTSLGLIVGEAVSSRAPRGAG